MLARFCAADYRHLGITGIKIHRITRVYNRMLRSRFDEKLAKKSSEASRKCDDALARFVYFLFKV